MAIRSELQSLFANAQKSQELALEILTLTGEFFQNAKESGQRVTPELDQYLESVASRANAIERRSRQSKTAIGED